MRTPKTSVRIFWTQKGQAKTQNHLCGSPSVLLMKMRGVRFGPRSKWRCHQHNLFLRTSHYRFMTGISLSRHSRNLTRTISQTFQILHYQQRREGANKILVAEGSLSLPSCTRESSCRVPQSVHQRSGRFSLSYLPLSKVAVSSNLKLYKSRGGQRLRQYQLSFC